MNFSGRWYTRDGTLVAVHRNDDTVGNGVGEWWGHELPFSDKLIFWDEKGDCVRSKNVANRILEEGFDLVSAVNREKQANAFNIECTECEECMRWKRER
jgi:hypothetical protein